MNAPDDIDIPSRHVMPTTAKQRDALSTATDIGLPTEDVQYTMYGRHNTTSPSPPPTIISSYHFTDRRSAKRRPTSPLSVDIAITIITPRYASCHGSIKMPITTPPRAPAPQVHHIDPRHQSAGVSARSTPRRPRLQHRTRSDAIGRRATISDIGGRRPPRHSAHRKYRRLSGRRPCITAHVTTGASTITHTASKASHTYTSLIAWHRSTCIETMTPIGARRSAEG